MIFKMLICKQIVNKNESQKEDNEPTNIIPPNNKKISEIIDKNREILLNILKENQFDFYDRPSFIVKYENKAFKFVFQGEISELINFNTSFKKRPAPLKVDCKNLADVKFYNEIKKPMFKFVTALLRKHKVFSNLKYHKNSSVESQMLDHLFNTVCIENQDYSPKTKINHKNFPPILLISLTKKKTISFISPYTYEWPAFNKEDLKTRPIEQIIFYYIFNKTTESLALISSVFFIKPSFPLELLTDEKSQINFKNNCESIPISYFSKVFMPLILMYEIFNEVFSETYAIDGCFCKKSFVQKMGINYIYYLLGNHIIMLLNLQRFE